MLSNKIVVTGIKGTVGFVIQDFLSSDYLITEYDLPENDALDYSKLREMTEDHHALIHLAWDMKENYNTEIASIDNIKMIQNIFRVSLENQIQRVIFASTVHVHDFINHYGQGLITVDTPEAPGSIYGISNWYGEKLGQYYSQKGIKVICLRLGGVIWNNTPSEDPNDQKVFLDRRDCADLFKVCIEAKRVPNNYCVMYAVSENSQRIHDYSNPFGWKPKFGWPDRISS